MRIESIGQDTAERLRSYYESSETVGQSWLLIYVTSTEKEKLPMLIEDLNQMGVRYVGGIMPGVMDESGFYDTGLIAATVALESEPLLIPDLSNPKWPVSTALPPMQSVFLMMNGLSSHATSFLEFVHNSIGNQVSCMGLGCGDLHELEGETLFDRRGLYKDAAFLLVWRGMLKTGVTHGWKETGETFIATSVERNRLMGLNWEPAVDVYRRAVLAAGGPDLNDRPFWDVAKTYPLGMQKYTKERIVRDPIAVSGGDLYCVGDIPEHSILDLMVGDMKEMQEASKAAVRQALAHEGAVVGSRCLIVDCISRKMFMGDSFRDEYESILEACKADWPDGEPLNLFGGLSIGEIASDGEGYLDFLNKTTVAGVIYE